MARSGFGLSLCLLFSIWSAAQNQPPSDPQALSFAFQSMAAMTGGSPVTDTTLAGSVSWVSGSDTLTGQGTFLAKGATESRLSLTSSAENRTDIRNSSSSVPQGEWIDTNGTITLYAMHNCMTDAAWFFPPLGSLSNSDSTLVLTYIGAESRSGASVQHLQAYRYAYHKSATTMALLQHQSTMDFYLDASSFLPVAIVYNEHPDDDGSTDIPAEVDFSNYQSVNGFQVPLHVQQYLRGGLMLDLTVSSAVMNSGLPDSDFTIQ